MVQSHFLDLLRIVFPVVRPDPEETDGLPSPRLVEQLLVSLPHGPLRAISLHPLAGWAVAYYWEILWGEGQRGRTAGFSVVLIGEIGWAIDVKGSCVGAVRWVKHSRARVKQNWPGKVVALHRTRGACAREQYMSDW